ncbi:MAG: hypothetical protein ACD_18C00030G0008 [uncultured bacterium]|nr:MAG: hypothetical protein ACD_18C00030G0008 [uncultured bacterium]OGH91122.1 MAG: hypothetical protein A2507_00405 [Candidatus Magasanikbacteria bacterium RIFOXYD12_FULL_33_17]HAO51847.1 excinuclease ABC subunit C [Candidatus Magasanikbacteria bacterium]
MEEKNYYVYILSSISKVLYVGFTDCLVKRIYQHKKGDYYKDAFTKKYKVNRLVYWENFYTKEEALAREKQLKRLLRIKKISLIENSNPYWNDLYNDVVEIQKRNGNI